MDLDKFIKEDYKIKKENNINKTLISHEEKLIKFTTEYTKLIADENDINYKLNLYTTENSKYNNIILKMFDSLNLTIYGGCNNQNVVTINICYFLFNSLFKNQEENIAELIATINHELTHAKDNEIRKTKTLEYYKILKFDLLHSFDYQKYEYNHKNHDREINAYLNEAKSILDLFSHNPKLIKKYTKIYNQFQSLKTRDYYDETNIEVIDNLIQNNFNNQLFIKNYDFLKYEYNIDGSKKTIEEIILAKDDEIDFDLYNHIGYIALMKTNKTMPLDENIIGFINYGLNYEYDRLKINNTYTLDSFDRLYNTKYIKSRIEHLISFIEKEKENGKKYTK